jgi:hypothetical protein
MLLPGLDPSLFVDGEISRTTVSGTSGVPASRGGFKGAKGGLFPELRRSGAERVLGGGPWDAGGPGVVDRARKIWPASSKHVLAVEIDFRAASRAGPVAEAENGKQVQRRQSSKWRQPSQTAQNPRSSPVTTGSLSSRTIDSRARM